MAGGTRRGFLAAGLGLALSLAAVAGAAQVDPIPDPWQYPALAQSRVFQRWWWAYHQRAYPLGEIPTGAKARAFAQMARAMALQPRAAVQGSVWMPIGPAPIPNGQVGMTPNTSQPMSGRVSAIAVDPTDTTHWLIGAAQGGVWETHDSGTTWTPKTDDQASLAFGAVAFAPSNASIIYAGTGEGEFGADSYAGAGLLKSTDGGSTWQLLASSTFAKLATKDIRVDPGNASTLLAALATGIAGRSGTQPPSAPSPGIYKSTDGGSNWAQKLNGIATSLVVGPTDFSHQYGGIGDIFGSASNGVYRSTDAGNTWAVVSGPWTSATGGIGRVELAIAPSDPNTVYVSIQDRFDGIGTDAGLLGLWKTANAWATTPAWTAISVAATDDGSGSYGYCGWDLAFGSASTQCFYNHELSVDPSNASVLYAGGIPLWRYDGTTWMEVSKTVSDPGHGIHVDQHALAWAGSRLIVGNDGGVWSTADGGGTWSDHNTNLQITQFYYGSLHPTNPSFALGAAQDNGTSKWTGTNAWPSVLGSDGGGNAISASSPNTNWAGSFFQLQILRTVNGGTFSSADSGIDRSGASFIAPLAKCPANDDVFLAPSDNLWRTTNFFSSAPGSPAWSSNGPEMGRELSALAFAPSDGTCATYAFGTGLDSTGNGGDLRLTTNGGGTWKDIDAGNGVPNRYVTALAFDPGNANVLWVALSGFDEGTPQPGHLFKTTNALAASPAWTNVTPPVNIPHNAIAIDPADSTIVFVGTDIGVWKTADGGSSWTAFGPSTGMPNVAVFDLQLNDTTNRLVAFTHGRGAFALSAPVPSTTTTTTLTMTSSTTTSTVVTVCGDAMVNAAGDPCMGPEQCDDGNTVSGDGCSATCQVEPCYTCTGTPSVCTPGSQLTLTPAARCRNFTLTTYASGFPEYPGGGGLFLGPLSAGYRTDGKVLVTDFNGDVRLFPSHADGQTAPSPIVSHGYTNATGLAQIQYGNGYKYYLTQGGLGRVIEVDENAAFVQVIVTIPGATGITPYPPLPFAPAGPHTGHLYLSTGSNGQVWEVDPVAKTATLFTSGISIADGMIVAPDGATLFVADLGDSRIRAFDTTTTLEVWDSPVLPGGTDGVAIGVGALTGYIYANLNGTTNGGPDGGRVWEIGLPGGPHAGSLTQIASCGTRGDFVTADPAVRSGHFVTYPSLLVTQSDRVLRLDPRDPDGGWFWPTGFVPSFFECYELHRVPFLGPAVSLVDQFGSAAGVPVQRPERLCMPADKDDEEPDAPLELVHLTGYRVRHPFTKVLGQRIVNELGEVTVDVLKPDRLLVPSAKSLVAPAPPPPASPTLDHYQCYKIRLSRGAPRFVPIVGVKIDDQLETVTAILHKPVRLCAPVDKNGETPGAEGDPDHLLCYRAEPPQFGERQVYLTDQFGSLTRTLIRREEFCVSSRKNP